MMRAVLLISDRKFRDRIKERCNPERLRTVGSTYRVPAGSVGAGQAFGVVSYRESVFGQRREINQHP